MVGNSGICTWLSSQTLRPGFIIVRYLLIELYLPIKSFRIFIYSSESYAHHFHNAPLRFLIKSSAWQQKIPTYITHDNRRKLSRWPWYLMSEFISIVFSILVHALHDIRSVYSLFPDYLHESNTHHMYDEFHNFLIVGDHCFTKTMKSEKTHLCMLTKTHFDMKLHVTCTFKAIPIYPKK